MLTVLFRSGAREQATTETFYSELKNSLDLKEEVLLALKHVWSEQVRNLRYRERMYLCNSENWEDRKMGKNKSN